MSPLTPGNQVLDSQAQVLRPQAPAAPGYSKWVPDGAMWGSSVCTPGHTCGVKAISLFLQKRTLMSEDWDLACLILNC